MVNFSLILATAEETEPVDSAGGLGIGAIALLIAVVLIMLWMGYLFVNSRRKRSAAGEPAPSNLSPAASDDELENKKLTVILRAALFGSALLAIAMPWYAFNEPDRQAEAAEQISELDIHEGEHWFSSDGFACADCHGPTAGGGAARYTEDRSGVDVSWSVPSLDDVFYRYGEEEVRYWIVFGRAGTPMPANGLEGGGAMTVQEIDQTMAYLQSIQISQADAFARVGPAVDTALQRIENGALTTQSLINKQTIEIEDVKAADSKRNVVGSFPDDIKDLFQAPGTCTETSAALVGTACDNPGQDSDRDGLSDDTERALTAMAATSMSTITVINSDTSELPFTYSFGENPAYDLRFDPFVQFTNTNPDTRAPWADLEAAESMLSHLETDVLLLNVTADRERQFLDGLEPGLDFLDDALTNEPWAIDFDAVASAMGVSASDAEQAVGLFNAYCARCHTGGYSAGPSFEQGAGSGAWGPALTDGKAVTQFPNVEDHMSFILTGSVNAKGFGVNGIGTGRMPGFGNILSADQIELIALYERTM